MSTPQASTALENANGKHSLVVAMANRYQLEPQKFLGILEKTIFPADKKASTEQVAAFLVVANQYQLNPFIKEIYAFPGKGGGVVPIVSVDGWLTIINRQPNLDGVEYEDHLNDAGVLTAITCRIYRKDRKRPNAITEYMSECRRETDTWKKWPSRMLRHKALIQCARQAFGLAGIYDPDEAERIAENDGAVVHPIAEKTRERAENLRARLQPTAEPIDEPVIDVDWSDASQETESETEPQPIDKAASKKAEWITLIDEKLTELSGGEADKIVELTGGQDLTKMTVGQLKDLYLELEKKQK